jgi:hypothetical protein
VHSSLVCFSRCFNIRIEVFVGVIQFELIAYRFRPVLLPIALLHEVFVLFTLVDIFFVFDGFVASIIEFKVEFAAEFVRLLLSGAVPDDGFYLPFF